MNFFGNPFNGAGRPGRLIVPVHEFSYAAFTVPVQYPGLDETKRSYKYRPFVHFQRKFPFSAESLGTPGMGARINTMKHG
jgi:hypothetical protein